MTWVFFNALIEPGIPAQVAQVVNDQFAKVEAKLRKNCRYVAGDGVDAGAARWAAGAAADAG